MEVIRADSVCSDSEIISSKIERTHPSQLSANAVVQVHFPARLKRYEDWYRKERFIGLEMYNTTSWTFTGYEYAKFRSN